MGVACCQKCGCKISISVFEGGNPVAKKAGWRDRYTKCPRCEAFYCSACVHEGGGRCPSCRITVEVYSYLEEMERRGHHVPDYEAVTEDPEQDPSAMRVLLQAVQNRNVEEVRAAVSRSPGLVHASSEEGYTGRATIGL